LAVPEVRQDQGIRTIALNKWVEQEHHPVAVVVRN